jgi:hypothetical protein
MVLSLGRRALRVAIIAYANPREPRAQVDGVKVIIRLGYEKPTVVAEDICAA